MCFLSARLFWGVLAALGFQKLHCREKESFPYFDFFLIKSFALSGKTNILSE